MIGLRLFRRHQSAARPSVALKEELAPWPFISLVIYDNTKITLKEKEIVNCYREKEYILITYYYRINIVIVRDYKNHLGGGVGFPALLHRPCKCCAP